MRTIAERYQLADSLGSGGMAHVYRAHDTVLQRDVALKLLREEVAHDDTLRERFLREARLAGSLTNRHVVRVYDAGVDGSTPWMAMELVEGPSLREQMTARGPYPLQDALPVFGEVLEALEAAHTADVIHRDIKPANILLSPEGAKLGDFGIAKSLGTVGADLTQFNQFLGTPKYTAPEVAMGNPATRRSDVYAAAVVFWEMLAGHPPYDHPNPLTLAMMHRTDPLPSIAAERKDLPPALVSALERALEKDPSARPSDAASFARSLRTGADAPPPPVPPPHTAPRPQPAGADPAATARLVLPGTPPPLPAGHATAHGSSSPAAGRSSGWGLAILVALLIGAAVVAFILAGGGGDAEPEATPTPSTSPATSPAPTSTSGATSAPDQVPAPPVAPPAPAPPAQPTPAPGTTPTPPPATPTTSPTAAPTSDPAPTATAAPTATEEPNQVVPPLPLPGQREPTEQSTDVSDSSATARQT